MRKILLLIAALGVFTFSCEDMEFIEPRPRTLITPAIALGDLNGIDAVLASAYNRLMNFDYYGQRMMLVGDALADNLIVGNNTGRYVGEQVNQVRSHLSIWDDPANPNGAGFSVRSVYNAYRTINDCNIIIDALSKLTVLPADQPRADNIRGQALFLRALSYHDLLKVYSYEPGREQNGFNLGVVMRTTPTLGAADADLRARSTNLDGYQQVEADLLAAIPLLEAEIAANAHRVNAIAARALLSRVYLYWGRWADAATQAEFVLNNTLRVLADAAGYAGIWTSTINPEAIFELRVDLVDWNTVDGVNNSLASVTRTNQAIGNASQGSTKLSPELVAAFEAGDVRGALVHYPAGPNHPEMRKWNGELTQFREHIPLIRYSEVLLIAAEARARSGNDAAGLAHVNRLRTNRGLAASTASGQALIDLILQERRVELALEGHRFFDFKRLGLPIPKTALAGGNPILANDFRILAPLNPDYLSVNNLAVDNPGYSN